MYISTHCLTANKISHIIQSVYYSPITLCQEDQIYSLNRESWDISTFIYIDVYNPRGLTKIDSSDLYFIPLFSNNEREKKYNE